MLWLSVLTGGKVPCRINGANMRLDLREAIQKHIFLNLYEPVETGWVRECLHPGDVFVDVGANVGYFTTLAASCVGASGRVFAFEPSPLASGRLADAIRRTPLDNVHLTKAAVGDRDGSLGLYMPADRVVHSPSAFSSDPSHHLIDVPLLRLDRFEPFDQIDTIKMVKIDVEGSEPNVIHGMAELLRSRRVLNISCELNSGWLRRNSETPEGLSNLIESFGYKRRKATTISSAEETPGGPIFSVQDVWFTIED